MYTQTQSIPEPHIEMHTNTAEDRFCVSLFTHAVDAGGKGPGCHVGTTEV